MADHPADEPTTDRTDARRAPRRRRSGALLLAAGFVAGSFVAGAGAAWASHQFPDVPTSSPFHADIAWLVDNGIADGYADGTFKPTNPVSRQAMAAFLHRYNGEVENVNHVVTPGPNTEFFASVTCPAGKRAIAGGGLTFDTTVVIASSSSITASNWQVRWVSRTGSTVDPASLGVSATCIPT